MVLPNENYDHPGKGPCTCPACTLKSDLSSLVQQAINRMESKGFAREVARSSALDMVAWVMVDLAASFAYEGVGMEDGEASPVHALVGYGICSTKLSQAVTKQVELISCAMSSTKMDEHIKAIYGVQGEPLDQA